ncbi:MAG TPA: acyltransferase, partial [Chitinophagaceae bacterium]|nr:acyltransferase [Chitinophagaceae bacterium]
GSNCAISWNVQIMDTDIHTLVVNGQPKESTKKIKIGNNVWIGSNVIILKGAEIGNNVVIAAGSIVSGNIPDNVLIAGVPAKIVKEQISWLL